MTTFLLIRHGETEATGQLLMGRVPGWHLNTKGREQVARLAEGLSRFPLRAIYTSPLERAIETAMPIAAKHGLEPNPMAELSEMHMGEWEGLSFAELDTRDQWQRFNACRSAVRCPGGELMAETQSRIVGQLDRLRKRHRGEVVAVVSHGDPLRAAVAYFLGIPLDNLLRFEISPASVTSMEIWDRGSRLMYLNASAEGLS